MGLVGLVVVDGLIVGLVTLVVVGLVCPIVVVGLAVVTEGEAVDCDAVGVTVEDSVLTGNILVNLKYRKIENTYDYY